MSDSTVAAESCGAIAASHQQVDAFPPREVALGHLAVVRALPVKGKRGRCGTRARHFPLLAGADPLPETTLMWWNFVARTPEEIREARNDWEAHCRFGDVPASKGSRTPAPALVGLGTTVPGRLIYVSSRHG